MSRTDDDRLAELASFLPFPLRTGSGDAGGGTASAAREVVLLWCDIAGFSAQVNLALAAGQDAIEGLHLALNDHYNALLEAIMAGGGEPVSFIGDGLLAIWPTDRSTVEHALVAALLTAEFVLDRRARGLGRFDLNLNVTVGSYRTIVLGGQHDRWLPVAIGTALSALQGVGELRQPNTVLLTASASARCPPGTLLEPLGEVSGEATVQRLVHLAAPLQSMSPGADPIASAPVLVKSMGEASAAVPPAPRPEDWTTMLACVPPAVSRWIETIGLQWAAEARPVSTIMIALHDLDTATADIADRLELATVAVQRIVHGHAGSVAMTMVDDKGASIMALFGTPPDAHSDDPRRSVAAAAEIHQALEQQGIGAGIGVATGAAFCGIVGNAVLRCYLVIGDSIIRAARLAAAGRDSVLVDERTAQATSGQIAYAAMPQTILLKGQADPVPAWLVCPAAAVRSARSSDAGQASTGRTAERARLHRLWAEARDARIGAAIVIEGESGIGKTHLALDLGRLVVGDAGFFAVATASVLEQDTPFRALRGLLVDALRLRTVRALDERARAILKLLPHSLHGRAPLLNAVFQTGLEETPETGELVGQARALAIGDLLLEVLGHTLAGHPACFCIDDAQWLDPASRQLLARLRRRVGRLLILVLTQPSEDAVRMDELVADGFQVMRLSPLAREELRDLVRQQLDCSEVDGQLLDYLRTTTQGNPFFSSEIVRSLGDQGRIRVLDGIARHAEGIDLETLVLPDSIKGAVLQRLDQLAPEEQLTLRVGAVAGMSFPTQLAHQVHPLSPSLPAVSEHLAAQVRRRFLEERSSLGLPGYGFAHVVVREVAYSQAPRTQRRELHRRIAEWIDDRTGDERASHHLVLAYHWSQAGITAKAVASLLAESLRRFAQGFATEAVSVGLRAIRLSGQETPAGGEALRAAIGENLALIDQLAAGRPPTALAAAMRAPDEATGLQLAAILSTAPFAFQSNQFELFAWAASTAMRLTLAGGGGPPHAFSMHSIVHAALTGDRPGGAAWSKAALELDAATGGAALPAVGFIHIWFHGHWHSSIADSVATCRDAAARAAIEREAQYLSYNVSAEIVLRAANGEPLSRLLEVAAAALKWPLHRNGRFHVLLERQYALALRGQTQGLVSLSDHRVDEAADLAWVTRSEFANQAGYYLATKVRLHRHASDWHGALAWAAEAAPYRPAIAGQLAEVDLVLHTLLARLGLMLAAPEERPSHLAEAAGELALLAGWRDINAKDFGHKHALASLVLAGLEGASADAAAGLVALAARLGPNEALQDRAMALEYAARLDPAGPYITLAVAAYRDWGAAALADRLEQGPT